MDEYACQRARDLYSIAHWGEGYFDCNADGHLVVRPRRHEPGTEVDLYSLSRALQDQGLSLPVLVRFNDILHDRVSGMCQAFREAMRAEEYAADYTAVYPIKVNQQRSVVEHILADAGGCVGLEAGSKPELLAVLALSRADDAIVICNGYKDREYIRLALIGRRLGLRCHLVVEKLSELQLIVAAARELGVRPLLGLRVRLASIGAGKWQNTGGEKAKFGLSAQQVLTMVEELQQADMLDCLQLLHFHMGSQIAHIRDIQRGLREAGRYFAELHRLGVPIGTVDVGGGLGVDYEGTRSRSACSINYSLEEYARNVVRNFAEICDQHQLPQPHIITESGRAMTAHHAVLITQVVDSEALDGAPPPVPRSDEPTVVLDLREALQRLPENSALETYHDAAHWLAEARTMYIHGSLTLEERARAEQLFFAICAAVRPLLRSASRAHREVLDELNDILADKYFCNFSVFQSIPDVWAIDQVFPIVPLQRLLETPERRAVLQDLTCDSDGRIDAYVDSQGVESSLPMHALRADEPYLLGIFMVGAYQEILGDMHNLFGDTNSVNVELDGDGGYRLSEARHGETVSDVLRHVHLDAGALLQAFERKLKLARLEPARAGKLRDELAAGLDGYTYLED